mmetsp:Transcript_11911/g.17852  ORF Transcript_11911/g.17852 Transcript_11911/m.17852 type:complete len:101 (+) Transcript_11911:316-618(+)
MGGISIDRFRSQRARKAKTTKHIHAFLRRPLEISGFLESRVVKCVDFMHPPRPKYRAIGQSIIGDKLCASLAGVAEISFNILRQIWECSVEYVFGRSKPI